MITVGAVVFCEFVSLWLSLLLLEHKQQLNSVLELEPLKEEGHHQLDRRTQLHAREEVGRGVRPVVFVMACKEAKNSQERKGGALDEKPEHVV